MKKLLKTLTFCCLSIAIGIVIGSSSKSLLKDKFINVNSSPEKVIESYLNAYYKADADTMEQCLSPDLNDLKMLEYFGARGSSLARSLIKTYNEYLYDKQNPPEDAEKEIYKLIEDTKNNIENHGLVKAHVENNIKKMEDDHKYYKDTTGKDLKGTVVDIKLIEEESDIDKDPSYIEIGIFVKKNNDGEQIHDDRRVVLQKDKGKYYIVDI